MKFFYFGRPLNTLFFICQFRQSPSGKSDILYFLPDLKGAQDYSTLIDADEIEIAEDMCAMRPQAKGCSPAFKDLAEMIMKDERLDLPTTIDELADYTLFFWTLLMTYSEDRLWPEYFMSCQVIEKSQTIHSFQCCYGLRVWYRYHRTLSTVLINLHGTRNLRELR